jgi:Xaa-Pro aminopeptidase
VTLKEAAVWTDGRYFLQASKQLDSEHWQLMKAGLPETPSKEAWLGRVLESGDRVGVDPSLISWECAGRFREALARAKDGDSGAPGLELAAVDKNLVDAVWMSGPTTDYPRFVSQSIEHLPLEFAGRASSAKLSDLQAALVKGSAVGYIVTALDEIAWLFNLRGSDIPFNPVFFAFAFVETEQATLFIPDAAKLSPAAKSALQSQSVHICVYDEIGCFLERFGPSALSASKKIMIGATCNWKLVEALGISRENQDRVIQLVKPSPIEAAKAIKNAVELDGFRQCHIRDGAALTRYFAWLEAELAAGRKVDEVAGADQLEAFRAQGAHYRGLSFDTISGAGPNGAIIHYKPEASSAATITTSSLYLCDSGAQYLDGTTDVTRTLHFGTPTAFERECFTRVLKGNIDLCRSVFPHGTSGFQLDALARAPLWSVGLDFRHGTGHGVGHYLNVHEGPQSISFRVSSNDSKLVPGMTVTDEPGYYEDGKFGIRIEDVLVVKEASTRFNFGGVKYYCFENLTMVHMRLRLESAI